ncbi:uncharacterized protein LOC100415537 isoform X2 [Callithrix jacchus]
MVPSTGLRRRRGRGREGESWKGVGREGRRRQSSQSARGPSADRLCLHQVHAGCGEHKAGRTEGAGSERGSEARPVRPRLQAPVGRGEGPAASARAIATAQRHPYSPGAPSSGPGRSLPRPLHPTSLTLFSNPACPCPGLEELTEPSPVQQLLLVLPPRLLSWCSAGGPPRSQCALRAGKEAPLGPSSSSFSSSSSSFSSSSCCCCCCCCCRRHGCRVRAHPDTPTRHISRLGFG